MGDMISQAWVVAGGKMMACTPVMPLHMCGGGAKHNERDTEYVAEE